MTVTIGLPFYNDEKYLANAIRSIFAQRIDDWKLILVDDGSTDQSLDIAMSVKDERVQVIQGKENRGLPYRLNQITSLTNSKYLARMDGDDMMHPDRLKKQIEILEDNPDLPCVHTGIWTIDDIDKPQGYRVFKGNLVPEAKTVLLNRVIIHATLTATTEWFRRNPYSEDCNRIEDYELWCRSFLNNDLYATCIDAPLYLVREVGSVTLEKMLVSHSRQRQVLRKYGRDIAGQLETNIQIAKSLAKSAIYSVAFAFRIQNRIIHGRNRDLTTTEKQEVHKVVEQIKNTSVPGFP